MLVYMEMEWLKLARRASPSQILPECLNGSAAPDIDTARIVRRSGSMKFFFIFYFICKTTDKRKQYKIE